MQILNRATAHTPPPPPVKILQFGGGNFLRAFTDWMVDLMNERIGYGGSVLIVKPTPGGAYPELERQEGLFHVCLRGISGGERVEDCRLISAVSRQINPYAHFSAFLESAELESIEVIVSNTTEAGIAFREADRLTDRPAISFPGKLTQWLYHRYRHFGGSAESGCAVLPCELIVQNGGRLRELVLRYAGRWGLEPSFASWLFAHVPFYNTLVDRIVPGFPKADASGIQAALGYRDDLLVAAEPYHLWAIEGDGKIQKIFPGDRAGLNMHFVEDLTPQRTLKVRLLNGAHTAMVPVGILAGLTGVRETVGHPVIGPFVRRLLFKEIIPSLDHDRAEAEAYAESVLERFCNPFIHHRLADIALNATAKFSSRLQPSLEAYYRKQGELPPPLVFALAALIRFYKGELHGRTLPVRDTEAAVMHFREAWQEGDITSTARRALSLWNFPNGLKLALEGEVASRLSEIDRLPVEALLKIL